jgi:hypothetical protein
MHCNFSVCEEDCPQEPTRALSTQLTHACKTKLGKVLKLQEWKLLISIPRDRWSTSRWITYGFFSHTFFGHMTQRVAGAPTSRLTLTPVHCNFSINEEDCPHEPIRALPTWQPYTCNDNLGKVLSLQEWQLLYAILRDRWSSRRWITYDFFLYVFLVHVTQ